MVKFRVKNLTEVSHGAMEDGGYVFLSSFLHCCKCLVQKEDAR